MVCSSLSDKLKIAHILLSGSGLDLKLKIAHILLSLVHACGGNWVSLVFCKSQEVPKLLKIVDKF